MLEKDRNGNPILTFPPCYAFQMIFTALTPRLIQSIRHNVHDKDRALKQLWRVTLTYLIQYKYVKYVKCKLYTELDKQQTLFNIKDIKAIP